MFYNFIKNLCLCFVLITSVFSANADIENTHPNLQSPIAAPRTGANHLPVLAPGIQPRLCQLIGLSYDQVRVIEARFDDKSDTSALDSDNFDVNGKPVLSKETRNVQKKQIQNIFEDILAHIVPYFTELNRKFTPLCKDSLAKHVKDISGDSPNTFLKKSSSDFFDSINLNQFPVTIQTHRDNLFMLPDWSLNPDFALYRKATRTLTGQRFPDKFFETIGKDKVHHYLKCFFNASSFLKTREWFCHILKVD